MPLGQHVSYLSDKLTQERRVVDNLLWEAETEQDFRLAQSRETVLQYLEDLYMEGEEYYVDF